MRRIKTAFSISNHGEMELRYILRQETVSNGSEMTKCYGIVVVSSSGECEHIRALTTCRKTARRLLRTMARCSVTPLTARDIVYDWLCVRDGDFRR